MFNVFRTISVILLYYKQRDITVTLSLCVVGSFESQEYSWKVSCKSSPVVKSLNPSWWFTDIQVWKWCHCWSAIFSTLASIRHHCGRVCQNQWVIAVLVPARHWWGLTFYCFLLRDSLTQLLVCQTIVKYRTLATAYVKVEKKLCVNMDQPDRGTRPAYKSSPGPWLWCLTTRMDLCFSTLQVKLKTLVDSGEVVENSRLRTSLWTEHPITDWLSSAGPVRMDR